MDLRRLRSFTVLAEERHFGRAAARLHVAQPALSQQLKQLETEIGTRLVDRSTRRVELTDAGRLLLTRATEILGSIDRTQRDIDALAAGLAGTVRAGFVGTATYDLLPRMARRVREELPDVGLELHGERLGPDLLDGVRDGRLDLAVLRTDKPPADAGEVRVELLREEPLVAVLPSGHPAAYAREVALADLSSEVFVTHPSGRRSMMWPRVLEACRRAGFEPVDVVEVGETGTLVAFVAAGIGVALVPASVEALRLEGVAYVPLAGTADPVPLSLVLRDDAGPLVERVAAIVRRTASVEA